MANIIKYYFKIDDPSTKQGNINLSSTPSSNISPILNTINSNLYFQNGTYNKGDYIKTKREIPFGLYL